MDMPAPPRKPVTIEDVFEMLNDAKSKLDKRIALGLTILTVIVLPAAGWIIRAELHFQHTQEWQARADTHFDKTDAFMESERMWREKTDKADAVRTALAKQAVHYGKQAASTAVSVKKALDKHEVR